MKAVAAVLGAVLAASLAACGGDSYDPGEEVWIDLKGDISVHQGYALAIVIDQRKELVEIQVNALEGGEGDEYLPVLKKGRAFVPIRIVQSRREGLRDVRRKMETIASYREILAQNVAAPSRVSDKAADRARRYKLADISLAFDVHAIYTDGILAADDKVDEDQARARAAKILAAMKQRLDKATREMTDAEIQAAVEAAEKRAPNERAAARHASVAHAARLARHVLKLALAGRDDITDASVGAAADLGAAVDAYVDFAWRYDPAIREALRRIKTPDLGAAKTVARKFYFGKLVARLRDRVLDRVALGLTLPLTDAQVDAKFAEARAAVDKVSALLRIDVVPAGARGAFAKALEDRVRKMASDARVAYIRANAHSLVLAGTWSGAIDCPAGRDAASFPLPLRLQLELDLASEGLGVFRGRLTASARATADDDGELPLLRRFLPGGRLPGEGAAHATLRIRVDTETGEVLWLRILRWTDGPPLLRSRIETASGHLAWRRPVAFTIEVCGARMPMRQAAPTR